MQRYIAQNDAVIADIFARADELNEDPLHGFLVALKLFAEMAANLPSTHPGCLVASFCYQDRLFSQDVRDLSYEGVNNWRQFFLQRLTRIAERYQPKIPIELTALADMANTVMDGGIIQSRIMRDKAILPQQIMLYRDFVRAVFLGA